MSGAEIHIASTVAHLMSDGAWIISRLDAIISTSVKSSRERFQDVKEELQSLLLTLHFFPISSFKEAENLFSTDAQALIEVLSCIEDVFKTLWDLMFWMIHVTSLSIRFRRVPRVISAAALRRRLVGVKDTLVRLHR